jgi:L-arabinose isomerase
MTTATSPVAPRASDVWFVTGSQTMYGEETLRQVAGQSSSIARALGADPDIAVNVVWKPVLTDAASIRRLCLDASADDACAGVIAWMHTFSPAKMWIAGLDALSKPLLHLHTQANVALPWSTIDMDFMNLNQAAHGDREFGYIQTRLGVARKTVAGHVSDPVTRSRVATWARAAIGYAELRTLRLARFGDNMRDVAVTEGDKVAAQRTFGVSVNTYAVTELASGVDGIDPARVTKLVAEYEDTYDVVPSLRLGGGRHDSLRYAASIELALRDFLAAPGATRAFGAFTTNFEDLGGLRQLPGLAVQRLMADGYGFGGEGDWKTAVLVRALKAMGDGLAGGTSFMEDYTYNLVPGSELILGAHMLEVCPSITAAPASVPPAPRPSCEIHPLSIGGREDPVRLVFDAAPGPAVVVGLSDLGDRFRLVANEVDVVAPPEPLPSLPVARAVWRPRPDLRTSAESWLTAGGPHHTALTSALTREHLSDLADMLGVELLIIDADTTPRQFSNEIRWNQAYYRLAQGL